MSTQDNQKTGDDVPSSETARLVAGIEKTRADMSGTVAALEARLSPTEIRGKVEGELHHVEEKVRLVVSEQLAEAKALVKEELVEAKTILREGMNEAESKIKSGLAEARDTAKKELAEQVETAEKRIRAGLSDARDGVKAEVHLAIDSAKRSIRSATIGRVEDIATKTGDLMNDSRDTLVDTIRANPLPAALAGVGIAWLFMNRSSSAKTRSGGGRAHDTRIHVATSGWDLDPAYPGGSNDALAGARAAAGKVGQQVAGAARGAADRAGSLAHDASEAAGNVGHRVTDAAGNALEGATDLAGRVATQTSHAASALAHGVHDASLSVAHGAEDAGQYVATGVKSQARRVEQGFHATLEENPLALGAAAIAIGALLGYALPRTHGEDALMGSARDEVLHRAGSATHDAAGFVGQLAEKSVGAAKDLLADGTSGAAT